MAALVGYILCAFGTLVVILLARTANVPLIARVLGTAGVTAMFLATWRLLRVGIYVRQPQFKVINPLATVRITVGNISEFRLDETGIPHVRYPVLVGTAFLRDGGRVRIWALMLRDPPFPMQFRRVAEALEALNQLVETSKPA